MRINAPFLTSIRSAGVFNRYAARRPQMGSWVAQRIWGLSWKSRISFQASSGLAPGSRVGVCKSSPPKMAAV